MNAPVCENAPEMTCDVMFNCCDCGGNDCGCGYCFSCHACAVCRGETEPKRETA